MQSDGYEGVCNGCCGLCKSSGDAKKGKVTRKEFERAIVITSHIMPNIFPVHLPAEIGSPPDLNLDNH